MTVETKTKEPRVLTQFMAGIVAARQMICKGNICNNVGSKCLLLYYCCNANRFGKFYKSTLDICLETGLAESTIRELNEKWQTWKLLTVTSHDWRSGKANDYEIHLPVLLEVSKRTQELREPRTQTAKLKAAARSKKHRDKIKTLEAMKGTTNPITLLRNAITPDRHVRHTEP
jgi:hypothetical protein